LDEKTVERAKMNYPPPFQDLATLSAHICVSESAIENWVKLGLFPPPRKVGGKRLWSWREVERHLAGNKELVASNPDELAERIKNGTREAISRGKDN
jgi:predicted DNA-binding transcriptional regulator AlpA